MADEKKYSLISLDTGEDSVDTIEVEKRAGVTTTASIVDGEETIRVSSAHPAADSATEQEGAGRNPVANAASEEAVRSEASTQPYATPSTASQSAKSTRESAVPATDLSDDEDDEPVPYRKMQSIIIICLVVLIVVFITYFNFFR